MYTVSAEFYREVPYDDQAAFKRSLANKTSGMTEGEIKIIYVNGYIFESDGYMHGRILASYNEKTKKLLEVNKNKYDRINENRRLATVWTEAIQDAEGGSSGDSDISRRGRSGADDRLLGETSERDSSGDNERVWTNPRTEEEYHEIVNKLRAMYGLEPVDYSKGKFLRELDTEYLSAVNRGDMETAQRKVDEAAKEAEARADCAIETKSAQLKAEYTTDKVFSQSSVKSGFESVPEVKKLPAKVREDIARDLWLELEASDSQDLRNEKNTHRKADLTERWVISI